jgi:hypothetical protein
MAHLRPSSRTGTKLAALLLAVCAGLGAQSPVPDPDGAARLLNFTGQISVMRGNYAWALNSGDAVKPLEMVITGPDGWGIFQVADGSKFEVYPNSKVVFRANRGDWKDILEVWLGKVRVQIEHFGGLPNNNKVRTPTAVISVRGTIFDVTVEDAQTHTTLVENEEGVVVVENRIRPSQVILKQGEFVRVFENQPLARAIFDRGGMIQRLAEAAKDALYQAAVNGHGTAVARGPVSGPVSSPGDHGGAAPPPPPTAPPPPTTGPPH